MRTSCIPHPANEPLIVIRQWQVEATGGDQVAAALLSFFEYWHNIKTGWSEKAAQANAIAEMHNERGTQDTSAYQHHTAEELSKGILGLASRDKIREALTKLEKLGYVTQHSNPNPAFKFDKTKHFLFHPEPVLRFLANRSAENRTSTQESRKSMPESRTSIPEITEPEITKNTPPAPQGGSGQANEEKQRQRKEGSATPTSPIAIRIHKLFNRGPNRAWDAREIRAFKANAKGLTEEDMTLLEEYYAAERAKGETGPNRGIHRKDLKTFINNLQGELDRAIAWKATTTPTTTTNGSNQRKLTEADYV